MALKNNTWKINQWYDQNVSGNVDYSGAPEMWAWGYNPAGELGQNNRTNYSSPIQIAGTTWSKVGVLSYGSQSIATKTDGTLWMWGYNDFHGNLGQNNLTSYSSPVQIPGSWKNSTVGYNMTAAIKTDGTLWSWGDNNYGQLGQNTQGTPSKRSSPIQIGSDTTWEDISAAVALCHAVKTDGTLWLWGVLSNGAHGNGPSYSPTQRSSPVQVGSATNWSFAESGGNYQMLASKTDGTLWAWGNNGFGANGTNSTAGSVYDPTQIPGAWAVGRGKFCVNYEDGACAIKADGTLWSWGSNNDGKLGLNQSEPVKISSPVQVGSGTDWAVVSSQSKHVVATKTDGTLWAWGNGGYGSLGLNAITKRSSPTQIPGTDWSTDGHKVAASYNNHNIVFKNK
tara:strand:- start:45 stop:1229 length:1185 start_codon:yes stop_codon:yes gene_type:complete